MGRVYDFFCRLDEIAERRREPSSERERRYREAMERSRHVPYFTREHIVLFDAGVVRDRIIATIKAANGGAEPSPEALVIAELLANMEVNLQARTWPTR